MKLFHYLKYCLFHIVGLGVTVSLLAGGPWMAFGLLAVLTFYILGDFVSGDDTTTPEFEKPGFLTFQLWLALPLLCLIVFTFIWSVSAADVFGYGAFITQLTGYDVIAAKEATGFLHLVAASLNTILMIGLVGTITAHELTHRTWDPVSMLIGRWLLAFSYDTIFSIEHVYGHHRYVSTIDDPATAPRGRNVYFHIIASTVKGNISAWKIEKHLLKRKKLPLFSWHNAVIRGHLMSVLLTAIAFEMGGFEAMLWFLVVAAGGKSLLEIVNYMEHYGMVRNPETPVQPRHSWNTNKRISSWTMFNLTRHSHHHAQGEVPFHELRPFPEAPMMISGYLTTLVVALIPPLWHRLMTPKVLEWDEKFASPEEKELARIANEKSGMKEFENAPTFSQAQPS